MVQFMCDKMSGVPPERGLRPLRGDLRVFYTKILVVFPQKDDGLYIFIL